MFLTVILSFGGFAYADNFSLTNDYADNKVFVTTLLSIDGLPSDGNEFYTIQYNLDQVVGVSTDELEDLVNWEDHSVVVNERYRRRAGVNDFVKFPPRSKLGVSALIKNESGHDVLLRDWRFFITRSNRVLADLGKFGVEGSFMHFKYKFLGIPNLIKEGYQIHSPLVVNVEADETKLVKLFSLEMHQPLEVQSFNWVPSLQENGDLIVGFVLKLKNIGAYSIGGVEFRHRDYYLKRNFPAGSEYIYEYQINYGNSYSVGKNFLESFEIKRAGPKTECLVLGSSSDGYFGDTKTLVFERSDAQDWFGKTVDIDWYPGVEAMCTTLIGYSLVGKELEYSLPLDISFDLFEDSGALGFDDGLIINLEIKNNGLDFDSLSLELFFDSEFQTLKNSTCDVDLIDDGLLWNVGGLMNGDELECRVEFEVSEKESFLNLKNTLAFEEESKSVFVKFVPDLSFSFNYDFLKKEFVFENSGGDSSKVQTFDEFGCRKVQFFNLEDEICI